MNKIYYILIIGLLFTGCSTRGVGTDNYYKKQTPKRTNYSVHKKKSNDPKMKPYVVHGVTYYPKSVSVGDKFHGIASWYGPDFNHKPTASGETYDMWKMTAAHKTLPLNTIVKVINNRNGKVAVVRINDRGPFVSNRIIDLSKAAAKKIGMIGRGTAHVTLEVIGFAKKGVHHIPSRQELINAPQNFSLAGRYALQIGSFSKIRGAMITQERYNHTDGYKTIIKDVESNNQRMFKVWLTGFKSEQEARRYKQNCIFENAFIVRED